MVESSRILSTWKEGQIMKKVLILGANGQIAKIVEKRVLNE